MRLRLPPVPVRWVIGILLFIVVLAWFTAPNPISNRDVDDPFVGRWLVNGEDSFGKEYSGSLSIRTDGTGYSLQWIVTGAVISGSGVRNGALLEGTWARGDADRRATGTVLYRLESDDRLLGTVTTDGTDEAGIEFGERLPGS